MCRPCAIRYLKNRDVNPEFNRSESANKCRAQIHAITRNDNSRLLAQLMPSFGGFESIHADACVINASANRSSPVSQYAWPSVTKCACRFNSQITFLSPAMFESRESILLQ